MSTQAGPSFKISRVCRAIAWWIYPWLVPVAAALAGTVGSAFLSRRAVFLLTRTVLFGGLAVILIIRLRRSWRTPSRPVSAKALDVLFCLPDLLTVWVVMWLLALAGAGPLAD
ncbi:MAG: hypothetical protein JXR37_09005 [Kiritimatiellae bacterium]|nr:hypothetical protein [Kiritimatiellia bacterium]